MAELNRSWLTVYGVSMEGEYCVTCPRLERRVYDYNKMQMQIDEGQISRPANSNKLNVELSHHGHQ